ncbi:MULTISPECIES: DUF3099 domain-containing protein [Streptomyces]|uniref:DUF3099 domain-containing protein n=1 Tax=Streptomyces TaxID=1883 RepID=UPI00099647E5|nr:MULTISPECIES: DUF3099 domain-containing protein [Streptomyces]QPA00612.1 DUF3099 domain-containing protein [Streptomyces violascens]RWZ74955.1 DUF3099 domain-containing protein [Streptomyces albidoflavus]WSB21130.1 DUF3099 domain-containing protein [Streptomyces albidoflavus]
MYARRRHVYFAMMGLCLSLFVVACAVVRLWSVPAAVAMCVVAMVIPPFAAVVANRKGPEDRWYDDPGAGSASGQAEEPPTPPTHVRKKDPRDGPGTPPVKPPFERGASGSTGISGGHDPGHGGRGGRREPLSDQDRVKGSDPESEAWWRELDRRGSGGEGPPGPPGHGRDPRRPGPWPEE